MPPVRASSAREVFNLPLHELPLVIDVRLSSNANDRPKIFSATVLWLDRADQLVRASRDELVALMNEFLRKLFEDQSPETYRKPVMYTFDESLDLTSLLSAFSETPSPLRPFDAILHLTQGELSRFVDLYPYVLIPHATAASASPVNTIFFPSEIPLPPHLPPNRLFLGSSSAASAAAVTAMGITHVLNVTREVKIPEVEGLRSLRVAIDDSFKVDVVEAYLTLAREFLLEALTCPDGGNRVLVHCQYGRSRSVSMAVAALAELTPCSVVEALATVQCERPVSRPNLMFMMQLKMWDGEGKPAVRSANAIDKGDGGMETMTGR